jgi:hypothetical protein
MQPWKVRLKPILVRFTPDFSLQINASGGFPLMHGFDEKHKRKAK